MLGLYVFLSLSHFLWNGYILVNSIWPSSIRKFATTPSVIAFLLLRSEINHRCYTELNKSMPLPIYNTICNLNLITFLRVQWVRCWGLLTHTEKRLRTLVLEDLSNKFFKVINSWKWDFSFIMFYGVDRLAPYFFSTPTFFHIRIFKIFKRFDLLYF